MLSVIGVAFLPLFEQPPYQAQPFAEMRILYVAVSKRKNGDTRPRNVEADGRRDETTRASA
jgi:hypothetical protein